MANCILIKDVPNEAEIRAFTDGELKRAMDHAPYDATAIVLLEKFETQFSAKVDVYSKFGPFIANVQAGNPQLAVERVMKKIEGMLKSAQFRRATAKTWTERPGEEDLLSA